jgi:hypothetical protein
MQSQLAALRSLTLPYGGTSGARIVLDGVTGTIIIYDSHGHIIVQIDPTSGIQLFDPDHTGSSLLSLSTESAEEIAAASIRAYESEVFNAANHNFDSLALRSPESGFGYLQLLLAAARTASAAPMIQFDTNNLDPTQRGDIDLTGRSAFPHSRVIAYEYREGENNGAGVAPTVGKVMCRGLIGHDKRESNTSFTTPQDTSLSAQIEVLAGHYTRVEAYFPRWASTVVGDRMRMTITDFANTAITSVDPLPCQTANVAMGPIYAMRVMSSSDLPLDTGIHTVKVRVERIGGTGTCTVVGAVGSPAILAITDVGTLT